MGHKYVKEDETFNTSRNGTVPKPTGQDITDNKFLRADGSWANGAGGSVVSADQIVSSGTEIGGVTVNGARTAFYAPYHNYSTAEQVVGTWIDGKPVYEKSYIYENSTGASGTSSNPGVYNVWDLGSDKIILPGGLQATFVNLVTNKAYPLPYADTTFTNIWFDTGYVKLQVRNDSWGSNYKLYMTARYKKTTD